MNTIKITCISKFYSRWHYHFAERFLQAGMEIEFLYIDKLLATKNRLFKTNESLINNLILKVINNCSSYIIYDLEFIPLLTAEEIKIISKKTKTISIGLAMDDDNLHQFNKYIYKTTDKIFASSYLSEMNYKSLGIPAHCFPPLEIATLNNITAKQKKREDYILIYGDITKADRKEKVSEIIKNNFNIKILDQGMNYDNLYEEIRKAKLVINFSKANNYTILGILGFSPHSILKGISENNKSYIYQAKGRIFEAGYLGTACISEYFPMHTAIASKNTLQTFTTNDEMIELISKIMKSEALAEELGAKLNYEITEKYNEIILANQLKDFMMSRKANSNINNLKSHTVTIATIVNKVSYSKNPIIILEYIIKSKTIKELLERIMYGISIFIIILLNFITLILNKSKKIEKSNY
jgi:glycosyltransferase involved in cell wall biosynthesis